jgi:GntR family transcriptional regulator, transcriptional repressor for pyruvate dehydrogenase complex
MRTRAEASATLDVRPPEPARLSDQVEAQIEDLIVAGEFAVGTRLPGERALFQRFAVSRTVIREAISRLESRGLLRVYPSRGTYVTGTPEWGVKAQWQSWVARDSDKLLAILEVRECLEIRAAALATERASDDDLAELRLAHLNFEQQCARGSLADMSHWDKMFHHQLAACSRNTVLTSFVQNVNDVIMSRRRSILADPAVASRSLEQHRRIVDAVEARDGVQAMRAVAEHIASTRETIAGLANVLQPSPDGASAEPTPPSAA